MKFFVFNIKLQSDNRKGYSEYLKLFNECAKKRESIILRGKYEAKVRLYNHADISTEFILDEFLPNKKENKFIYGRIVRYLNIYNDKWFDSNNNEIYEVEELDKNLYPGAQEILFFFYPQIHTMFIQDRISYRTLLLFLEQFFALGKKENENVNIHIEQSFQGIDMILHSEELCKLDIQITPSNDDDFAKHLPEFLDKQIKTSGTKSFQVHFANSFNNMGIKITDLIKGLMTLVKRNGKAQATIRYRGKKQVVKTEDHPKILEKKTKKMPESEMGIELFDQYMRLKKDEESNDNKKE